MKCSYVPDRILNYMEGVSSIEESQKIQQHIESCPECKGFYKVQCITDSLLKKDEVMDEYFYTKVAARIDRERYKKNRMLFRMGKYRNHFVALLKPAAVLVTACIFIAVIFLNKAEIENLKDQFLGPEETIKDHRDPIRQDKNNLNTFQYNLILPKGWTQKPENQLPIKLFDENSVETGCIERSAGYLPNHSQTLSEEDIKASIGNGKLYELERSLPAASGNSDTWIEYHALIQTQNHEQYDIWLKAGHSDKTKKKQILMEMLQIQNVTDKNNQANHPLYKFSILDPNKAQNYKYMNISKSSGKTETIINAHTIQAFLDELDNLPLTPSHDQNTNGSDDYRVELASGEDIKNSKYYCIISIRGRKLLINSKVYDILTGTMDFEKYLRPENKGTVSYEENGSAVMKEDITENISGSEKFHISNNAGDIRITAGSGSTIKIHTIKRVKNAEDKDRRILENIKIMTERDGNSLTIRSVSKEDGKTNIWEWVEEINSSVELSIDYEIEVPGNLSAYHIESHAGDIYMRDVHAQIDLSSTAGNIYLVNMSLKGNNKIYASAGDSVMQIDKIEKAGSFHVQSNAGDIHLTMPESLGLRLHAKVNAGDITSNFLSRTNEDMGSINEVLNGGGAIIELISNAGDIILNKN